MTTPKTYRAAFGSTGHDDRDAELRHLKDQLHTMEQIQALCRRYKVRATVFDASTGRVLVDLDRDGHEVTFTS